MHGTDRQWEQGFGALSRLSPVLRPSPPQREHSSDPETPWLWARASLQPACSRLPEGHRNALRLESPARREDPGPSVPTTTSGLLCCCSGSTPIIPPAWRASTLGPQHRRQAQARAAPLPCTGFGHALPATPRVLPCPPLLATPSPPPRPRPSGLAFLATFQTVSAVSISKCLGK